MNFIERLEIELVGFEVEFQYVIHDTLRLVKVID